MRCLSAGEIVALGGQIWLRNDFLEEITLCAAPAPGHGCLAEAAFSFHLRNPHAASSKESPATQRCPGSSEVKCTTHHIYVSSSTQPILPKAGIDLGHLKVEEAKGSVNQWVLVKWSTEGPMPSPTHNCILPFPLPFNSRERLDSALLPSLLDSALIVLFSLDISPNEARNLMTSHCFHS